MLRTLVILAVLPLGGCLVPFFLNPCGGADCPEPVPVEDGLYLVEDSDPVPMVDGLVDIAGDEVVIAWTDEEGNRWEAVYAVVGEFPER